VSKNPKTRILCASHHTNHTVEFHGDGTAVSSGCEDVEEQALRLSALARLRKKPLPDGGCVALVALIKYGIPQFLGKPRIGPGIEMGAWKPLYERYKTNKLVVAAMDATRRERDKGHAKMFTAARKALRKTGYRPGWSKADIDEATTFLPDFEMEEGTLVAVGEHDHFSVPLQEGWLENVVAAGIAVVSGKLVVGIDTDNPRHVFAIGKSKTGFFVVRPYELQTKPKLKLKLRGAA